jgi:hypothetical protein
MKRIALVHQYGGETRRRSGWTAAKAAMNRGELTAPG